MRHARVERWACGDSFVHRLHPAAKILATLSILIAVSILRHNALAGCAAFVALAVAMASIAKLPVGQLLFTAAGILPFAASFALITWLVGQPERAVLLVTRSYTSSLFAVLLIATTPMPSLISGLESLRAPRFLLLVMQFLYRYLVVLFEEAGAIRDAGASRGGSVRSLQLRQAGAAAGVLFARAYQRANAIHQAMLARGFEGTIPTISKPSFQFRDGLYAACVAAVSITLGIWIR